MKFKICKLKKVEENGRNYNELYLTDAESNSWESEITLRLTDAELRKMFPNGMSITTTLSLISTELHETYREATRGLVSAVKSNKIKITRK